MFTHRFAGSVVINGKPRQVNVEGSPLGRTAIQVDGMTAYDKKPFIQKEMIQFDVLPGKAASMRWHQVSPLTMECDITVDGQTTTLGSVAKDGSTRRPVGAKARQEFQVRYGGLGFLVAAAVLFWFNYDSVTEKGMYYPKSLASIPAFILLGIIGLLHPRVDVSPKNKTLVWLTAAGAGLLVLFGFTLFTDWFLATFGGR